MPKKTYKVKFYADSLKYGKNYLFTFYVSGIPAGKKLAKNYGSKSAWVYSKMGNHWDKGTRII